MTRKTIQSIKLSLVRESVPEYRPTITGPLMVLDIVRPMLENEPGEVMLVVLMDTRSRVIGVHVSTVGTLDSSLVNFRGIMLAAILSNAASMVIAHNHPSGDPAPSLQDLEVTKRVVSCCKMFDVVLMDHIIVGENGSYTSFKQLEKL